MDKLTNNQIAKEVKRLREGLAPVINQQFKELLIEIERRLSGKEALQPGKIKRKPQQGKRPTKQELYNKYFYKGL